MMMKKNDGKIGVIIPAYNTARFLPELLDSIVFQTVCFDNMKVLVVDDASDDNIEEVVKHYPRVVLHRFSEHKGVSAARNFGIDYFNNFDDVEYLMMPDSDDYLSYDFVEKALAKMNEHKVDLVVSSVNWFGRTKHGDAFSGDKIYDVEGDDPDVFFFVNNMLVRKNAIGNLRFYGEYTEDGLFFNHLWINLGKFLRTSSTEYFHRLRDDLTSTCDRPMIQRNQDRFFMDSISYADTLIQACEKMYGKITPNIKRFIAKETMGKFNILLNAKKGEIKCGKINEFLAKLEKLRLKLNF